MSIIKKLLGEKEETTVTIEIKGEGGRRFVEFFEQLSRCCNAGSSREIGILDPSDDKERAIKWSFDGDGSTRIAVKDPVISESVATAFKPERIVAFVEEFRAGKRILVLTARQAELVSTREDLRQYSDQPFVAFKLDPQLLSANYEQPKPVTPIPGSALHNAQLSAGTAG